MTLRSPRAQRAKCTDRAELSQQDQRRRQHDHLVVAALLGRNFRDQVPLQDFIADVEIADAIGSDDVEIAGHVAAYARRDRRWAAADTEINAAACARMLPQRHDAPARFPIEVR